MQTGKMTQQVTLRTNAQVSDGGGGYTQTPTDITGIWAWVEPLQGNEQLQAMQTGMKRPHRITMRYRAGMAATQTLLYGTRVFDIKSVIDPDEKHRELIVMADEVFP